MVKQLSLAVVVLLAIGSFAQAQSPFASSRSFGGSSFGAGGFRSPSVVNRANYQNYGYAGQNYSYAGGRASYVVPNNFGRFRYTAPASNMTYSSTSGYAGPGYYNYYLRNTGTPPAFSGTSAFGGYNYATPSVGIGYGQGGFRSSGVSGGVGIGYGR